MRNRAACKLCGDEIESFTLEDYVECSCGEIGISGGMYEYKVAFKDPNNFLRLDDMNKKKHIVYKANIEEHGSDEGPKGDEECLGEADPLEELDALISSFNNLPQRAMEEPVNHCDHLSLMLIFRAIFKKIISHQKQDDEAEYY